MKRIFLEFIAFAVLFFLLWGLLSRVNMIKLFQVQQMQQSLESNIGNLIWDSIQETETEIKDSTAVVIVDSIKNRICVANGIDGDAVKIHIMKRGEVNAFALPAGYLILNSEIIRYSKNAEELSSVMAHEIAHIQRGHVMRKIVKELGINIVFYLFSRGSGGEVARQITGVISSSAYDRSLESEADEMAVRYMLKSDIDPSHFSDLMTKLAKESRNIPKLLSWINTHPDSEERAANIMKLRGKYEKHNNPVIFAGTWKLLLKQINER